LKGHIDLLILLKEYVVSTDISEQSFSVALLENKISSDLYTLKIPAILHSIESWSEEVVFGAYNLDDDDISEILSETGTSAGWFPLIADYDALPPLPEGLPEIPSEIIDFLQTHERRDLPPDELILLKQRLRGIYEAGPGAKEEVDEPDAHAENDENEENEQIAVGARIPIPAETFLEDLSQKIEIHPISVYWLLKEGIEKEGLPAGGTAPDKGPSHGHDSPPPGPSLAKADRSPACAATGFILCLCD